MKKSKIVFSVDGVEYAVRKPDVKQSAEAQKVYNRTFRDAIESGAILASKAEDVIKEQGLWSDDKETEAKKLEDKLRNLRRKILGGGFKKSEGKKLALDCKKVERDLRELRFARNSLDANTAQSQAFAAQFNKLVSLCTVYNDTDEPYFASYDEFLEKQDDKVTMEAAAKMTFLIYNVDPDAEKKLPENKFLIDNGFVNDKLQWINKDGKTTDEEGRLVNEEGRYVNENNEFVDRDGNRVDEDGNPIVESKPVLDD